MSLIRTNILQLPNELPDHIVSWASLESVLTDRLKQISGEAKLTVLTQQFERTSWWARQTLSVADEMLFRRDILMASKGAPCWFARTLIPKATYQAHQAIFSRLENEPLTNLLYGKTSIERIDLFSYALNENCMEYYWMDASLLENQSTLWARLSTFQLPSEHRFYLVEIFLPGLERVCNRS